MPVGTLLAVATSAVSILTTAAPATEVLESILLTLVQVTTSLTVLALNASRNPEQLPRVRVMLDDLTALIQGCEDDLGTYALS